MRFESAAGINLTKESMQRIQCKKCSRRSYRNGRCYADNRTIGKPISDIVSCDWAGKARNRHKNLAGMRFERLMAIKFVGSDESGGALWHVRCDCGVEFDVPARNLMHGKTRSCGCLRRDLLTGQPGRNRKTKPRPNESGRGGQNTVGAIRW